MNKVFDLVRQLTDTVGTGTITLGAAAAEFRTFATGGAVDGDICTYAIADTVSGERAIEWGVYDSAGPTLTRGGTYPTGTAVFSLSGDAEIVSTPAAEDFEGLGGFVEPITLTEVLTSNYVLASVYGATVVNAGTGGTPGAATVIGTTGAGTKFELGVTIEAGGTIGSIDDVLVAGAYTVQPTDPTEEPVTGGDLTGATVRLFISFPPAIVGISPNSGFGFGNAGIPQLTVDGVPVGFVDVSNAFYGYNAGFKNSGANVIGLGVEAGTNNTGNNIALFGVGAGIDNIGNSLLAMGVFAGLNNAGNIAIAIGDGAGLNNTGDYAIAIGNNAATGNTGDAVTAIGQQAAEDNTGSNVIAIGPLAAQGNTVSNIINIGGVFTATGTDVPATSVVEFPGSARIGTTGAAVIDLPTPALGILAVVNDALDPAIGSAVANGGAAAALVWYNGVDWTVIGV